MTGTAGAHLDELRSRATELVGWPCSAPIAPLGLERLTATEEARLRTRLSSYTGTASEVALTLLEWVASRWRHSNANHIDSRDAHLILDRAERGARFACREYTILLTQTLNALTIPARVRTSSPGRRRSG